MFENHLSQINLSSQMMSNLILNGREAEVQADGSGRGWVLVAVLYERRSASIMMTVIS